MRGARLCLPAISPSRGIRCPDGFCHLSAVQGVFPRRSCQSPPLEGEMAGRPEGAAAP
ncbi:MAG: propionyl-coenzyme A carboxylase alpha polypeptide [Mesorhizobium sp.]|nr:MAG: propionyl-coenzyme A carboxylase alpha polypeptide [Mesorhizobium sp.]RWM51575.1 MAG: propionyl-coenzyme A carboxylase alpha polypeptide [Mesorhizobium sp.]RWM59852.1 MAG: propionyl-coenzyme A carboxylase alpha polypeptide [Mesorhizobium sp.]RWM60378.1 MAG: propionyl-coenzyme A carboxylase alpha polypeptide [Mesorhizobium sp.]RWN03419.1 MAG: propionyl-coenzyme A carboxylase alpha polypeptide [Mesorhizobium sp.]